MELETYLKRIWALWLSLPMAALGYVIFWRGLPERIVTKYDAKGAPIHWATKEQAVTMTMGVLGFVLLVTTAVGYFVGYTRPDRARSALAGMYVTVGFVWLLLHWIVWSQHA